MTTLTLDNNKKITFSSINELKIFVFENFWYPEIDEKVEENWHQDKNNWEEIRDIKSFISLMKNKNV